jgi:rare lipoprotein A (peptidoglycan hydrolase)
LRTGFAKREALLALVALLAGTIALAVTAMTHKHAGNLPRPVGSYTALAGSSGTALYGRHTACGEVIGPTTIGVAHPVLPCGVRVYISYANKHVLTQVIDHGPYVPGRQFDLTQALANELGLVGVQRIEWSYAQAG